GRPFGDGKSVWNVPGPVVGPRPAEETETVRPLKGASLMILFDDDSTTRQSAIPVDSREHAQPAKIKVMGVGCGGSNAVNRMIDAQLRGIEFIAVNTDVQALVKCRAPMKLQLGKLITRGLGAGSDPEIGRKAALEDTERILECLHG